jgi:hypothetical protein
MSDRPLRLLIAGLGSLGREHLARLLGRADVDVVGFADVDLPAVEAARAGQSDLASHFSVEMR